MQLIILDRDGVINRDRGDFIRSAADCEPIPGSIEAVARLSRAGFTPVVATNQSGLARGEFDLDDLEAIHDKLSGLVEEQGGKLEAVFYCPHHPEDGCKCRKPATGMLDAIEAEFNTSVSDVWFVGDQLRDLQAGLARDCQPVLVRTGRGRATEAHLAESLSATERHRVKVFDDLAATVEALLTERT